MFEFRDEIKEIIKDADAYCSQFKTCGTCPLGSIHRNSYDCYVAYTIAHKDGAITKETKTTIRINK